MPYLPDKWIHRLESLSQFLIIWSMITLALETEPEMVTYKPYFDLSEFLIITFFTGEYIVRIIYTENKWKYVFSIEGLIDLVAILPSIIAFGTSDMRTLRACRLLRILRIGKLYRYHQALHALFSAFKDVKDEIVVSMGIGILILYFSSLGIYHLEYAAQPETFGSISKCLWWSIISLTTVGYGDAAPITLGGRVLTAAILPFGIGIIGLPGPLIAMAMVKRHFQEKKAAQEKNISNELGLCTCDDAFGVDSMRI